MLKPHSGLGKLIQTRAKKWYVDVEQVNEVAITARTSNQPSTIVRRGETLMQL